MGAGIRNAENLQKCSLITLYGTIRANGSKNDIPRRSLWKFPSKHQVLPKGSDRRSFEINFGGVVFSRTSFRVLLKRNVPRRHVRWRDSFGWCEGVRTIFLSTVWKPKPGAACSLGAQWKATLGTESSIWATDAILGKYSLCDSAIALTLQLLDVSLSQNRVRSLLRECIREPKISPYFKYPILSLREAFLCPRLVWSYKCLSPAVIFTSQVLPTDFQKLWATPQKQVILLKASRCLITNLPS